MAPLAPFIIVFMGAVLQHKCIAAAHCVCKRRFVFMIRAFEGASGGIVLGIACEAMCVAVIQINSSNSCIRDNRRSNNRWQRVGADAAALAPWKPAVFALSLRRCSLSWAKKNV